MKIKDDKYFGPQAVGGIYRSGYWQDDYLVLDLSDAAITVTTIEKDGLSQPIRVHSTAWNTKRDTVIYQPN